MTLKLYRHALSGHAHRAELALSLLGLPHELVEAAASATATATIEIRLFISFPVLRFLLTARGTMRAGCAFW